MAQKAPKSTREPRFLGVASVPVNEGMRAWSRRASGGGYSLVFMAGLSPRPGGGNFARHLALSLKINENFLEIPPISMTTGRERSLLPLGPGLAAGNSSRTSAR